MKFKISAHFLFVVCSIGIVQTSLAQVGSCSGDYSCGPERITGVDSRRAPYVAQPNGQAQVSACGGVIPAHLAYEVRGIGVTCGEGAVVKNRLPTRVKKEVMDAWDEMSRSSIADAQNRMQQIRSENLSWSGQIEFGMQEHWTFSRLDSGFNSSKCGSEAWYTTCSKDWTREEDYYVDEEVEDRSNCLEYEPEPETPSYSGGGSSSYNSGSDSYSRPSSSDYGSGSNGYESSTSSQVDRASERNPDSISRMPNRSCLRYGTKTIQVKKTRIVDSGTYRYSCIKSRPRFCTWKTPVTMTRSCRNHKATYTVRYLKDPQWKPGYVDSKSRVRDYNDLIPNKFDLLPGESEKIYTYSNMGSSSSLSPKMVIQSDWNNYKYSTQVRDRVCRYNMQPHINYNVITVGRIKRKAPNVLAMPVGLDGSKMDPFANSFKDLDIRPSKVEIQDHSRATMLAASQFSRTFPRPEGAKARDQKIKAVYKVAAADPQMISSGLDMGFWVDTQFRVQMFRKDKWGRNVRMTPAMKLNSNQVDTFDNYLTIHLNDQMPNKFYRGTGPFEGLFGWAWSGFGVELSPGRDYIIRVQTVQRGLPFYESGCPKGDDTCEGKEASKKAFSAPLDIKFRANKNVKRSLWRKLKDWHEAFVIF